MNQVVDTKHWTLTELAERLNAELLGSDAYADLRVSHLADASSVSETSIIVLAKAKDAKTLSTNPAAMVMDKKMFRSAEMVNTAVLIVEDTRLAFARLSHLFVQNSKLSEGIHETASIHPDTVIAEDVSVGAHTVISKGANIASGTQIASGCFIGDDTSIAENCMIHPNVSLYAKTELGKRVTLHSGVVIGTDGFGYARSPQGALKIQHMGKVVLEDDVEVGANSCIDRATLGETRIGSRCKIDNLCQIGHNVRLGSDCLIAGTVAIAGSTTLGRAVILGGGSGVVDHVTIHDGAQVGARSLVTKSIPAGEIWNGYPAEPYKSYVRKHYLIGKLEQIWSFVKPKMKQEIKQS